MIPYDFCMRSGHVWRAVLVERTGLAFVSWQICGSCGERRYVASYAGADGSEAQEEHPWPKHIPEAVEEVMRREFHD